MADDLTADDLRRNLGALTADIQRVISLAMQHGQRGDAKACARVAKTLDPILDALREGYRLTPPPQPGTVTELDLIVFLEWLDSTRQVTEWGDPNATHEDTAREYLAQAPPTGNVTVNADDLRALLRPYDATRAAVMNAVNNVASALAEDDRGR